MEVSKLTKSNAGNYFTLRTTVPLVIRKRLHLNSGDHLIWDENEEGEIIIRKQK